jgi:DNA polymerase elongation subunit (family B)
MNFYTNVKQYGKYILYRGVENGKKISRRVEYRPTFFVSSNKKSKYKTLAGHYVEPIEPGNINDAREFLQRYEGVETFPVYGNNRYEYTFIADQHPEDEVVWDPSYIRVAYLDIEVSSANGFPEPREAAEEVTAITILVDGKYDTFGCGDYVPHRPDVTYHKCKDEVELLRKFIAHWSENYPDIVTGWNVKFFDMTYLINRMMRVLSDGEANRLSPWKKLSARETVIKDREQQSYQILGVAILDYQDLYKKYSKFPSQESYKLGFIASVELDGETKTDIADYDNLHHLYQTNYQLYVEYNIRDTELVWKLETYGLNCSKLIELALTLAYDNKCNYEDVFQQVRMWDAIIFNNLKKKKIVVPLMKKGRKDAQYAGAHVKPPKPGMYEWVVSFDLNSLYPHLIMMYNLSPETLIEYIDYTDKMKALRPNLGVDALLRKIPDLDFLSGTNVTVTPNQQFFSTKKRGFLAEIMDDMYKGRVVYKKKAIEAKKKLEAAKEDPKQYAYLQREVARYNNLQMAKKVSLNSAYGAIGNQYFRFFDIRIAEAITLGGQLSYKWIESHINGYLNSLLKTEDVDYVIAGDTDSMYLNLEGLVNKVYGVDGTVTASKHKIIDFLDRVCEDKIQPFIDKSYQELADYTHAYEQKMVMKRESLCDRAIWTAKKRYILNVYDEEGVRYKEPVIKTVGLETNRSTTPAIVRKKMRECIKIILNEDNDAVIKFIDQFREEFKRSPIEDISSPSGVNGIAKNTDETSIFKSGTPIHCKGAIVYNHIIKEKGLTKKYPLIQDGEKIKYILLKKPNPYHNNTIAFLNKLPPELELEEYIDYNAQFERTFIEPMKGILSHIGWEVEHQSTLESFFT